MKYIRAAIPLERPVPELLNRSCSCLLFMQEAEKQVSFAD
jgi:hypothetical protein